MMKVFGVGSSSKSDEAAKKQQAQQSFDGNDEDEIPIITDAVVVHDDDEEAPGSSNPPPPMNPKYQQTQEQAQQQNLAQIQQQQQQQQQLALRQQNQHPPGPLFSSRTPFYGLGRNPVGLQCPYCHRQTITVVQDLIGLGTLMAVFLLALFFWPLCWIPFCIPSCRRSHHYCMHSECRQKIGETSVCA